MDYQKIYNQIIERAQTEKRVKIKGGEYYEKHHIQPRCLGGSNDKSNLVLLTAREHFLCHRLLCEIYPNDRKLAYSLWMMCNGSNLLRSKVFLPTARQYEYSRYLFVKCLDGRIPWMKGRNHSEESKQKNREKHLGKSTWEGRTHTEESKTRMSKSATTRNITVEGETRRRIGISKGNSKPKSKEHRQNMSKSKLGANNPMYGRESHMRGKHYEKVICPHCSKEVAKTKINLFHNDNCKNKPLIP